MNAVKDFVAELAEVRSISPKPYVERSQQRQLEDLHRGAILKAQLLRVNDCLMRLTELIYMASEDGERDNVDPVTGRILVPKPWGSGGRVHFGLSRRTADIMRRCLLHKRPSRRPLLYFYVGDANDWYVNLTEYPTLEWAMKWVKHEQIGLSEWRQAGNEIRNKAATRRQRGTSRGM